MPQIRRCREVEERASKTIRITKGRGRLLDMALDHLTLGRSALYRSLLTHLTRERGKALSTAGREIGAAVDGLRAAGQLDYLPHGLFSRALFCAARGNLASARADLDEARDIADHGGMRLHIVDILLHEARLFGDRDALARARALVEETGYHRRDGEIADAEKALGASA